MAFLNSFRLQAIIVAMILSLITAFLLSSGHRIASPLELSDRIRGTNALISHVSNRTLGFQKVFAIVLPERTEQRDSLALAGALTGVDIDVIDGVTSVSQKAMVSDSVAADVPPKVIGAWRAHMNILQKIVNENISSALILEGDADWDIRLKSQLQTFARASKQLLQPTRGLTNDHFLDPTHPRAQPGAVPQTFPLRDRVVKEPTTSPYGDLHRWDVLWLGHCGSDFPSAPATPDDPHTPLARIAIPDDPTVPPKHLLDPGWGSRASYLDAYPPHTRVVARAHNSVCTLGYAVTQSGARKILYDIGLRSLTTAYDLALQQVCDGTEGRQNLEAVCVSVQPPLVSSWQPAGPRSLQSSINQLEGTNERAFSGNIRWSVRGNFAGLVQGRTEGFVDSFPDGEEAGRAD